MKSIIKSLILLLIGVLHYKYISAQAVSNNPPNALIQIPAETIVDKIRGGLLGQMIGNLNGLPHEMQYIEQPGNVKNYIPSLPDGARTDDDTDFEWVYITMMQKYRNAYLPVDTIYQLWKQRINRNIWRANRYARFLMDMGIKPPYTGNTAFNPWSGFNLSGQFLCETYGLIAPAMPQTAAKIGLHYTTVAILGEPAQTTQFFTTMVSRAFINHDINSIIDDGLAAIDPASELHNIVKEVRMLYKTYPANWRQARQLMKEKFTRSNNDITDKNGYVLNTACIIAALLYGEGDYSETMKMAFNLGWDADCNAATAGTIVGVIKGYKWMMSQGWQITDRYKNTTRDYMPLDETITSFSDRLIELFKMINHDNGGSEALVNNTVVFNIPAEQPAPVMQLLNNSDEKARLQKQLKEELIGALKNGSRDEKARAAYMAVCIDMGYEFQKKYPAQWKEACYDLSGYWKAMSNMLTGQYNDHFEALNNLKAKFIAAGFKAPKKAYSDDELYNDLVVWKDPSVIY